jgi:uncharacterized protein (DUF4415 family)
MRKEYDFKQLKVKRRGILPELKASTAKIRITISLDKDIIDYFKEEAKHPGAFPYQTQINQALRKMIDQWQASSGHENLEILKKELLHDNKFINQLAKKVEHQQRS